MSQLRDDFLSKRRL